MGEIASPITYRLNKILCICEDFPGGSVVKNQPAKAGDVGSIPGLGRSLVERNGNPLQYSCLGNPMDREFWHATKSQRWLSDWAHMHAYMWRVCKVKKCHLKWVYIKNNCQLCKRWNLGLWIWSQASVRITSGSSLSRSLWPMIPGLAKLLSFFFPLATSLGLCPGLHALTLATDPIPTFVPCVWCNSWEYLESCSNIASPLIWTWMSCFSSCLNSSSFAQPPTLGQWLCHVHFLST